MLRPPPESTRTDTRLPSTTRFRSSSPNRENLFFGTAHRQLGLIAAERRDRHRIGADEGQRIDRRAIDADFIVKMITRRTARRADVADDVPLLHMLPRIDDEARHMTLARLDRSEEHTSAIQSLMPKSYAVFCLKHK